MSIPLIDKHVIEKKPVIHSRARGRESGDMRLCTLAVHRQMKTLAALAKDGGNICVLCGRVARQTENLCAPTGMESVDAEGEPTPGLRNTGLRILIGADGSRAREA